MRVPAALSLGGREAAVRGRVWTAFDGGRMATNTHTRSGAAVSIVALLAALVAATAQTGTTHTNRLGSELDSDEIGLMGFAGHVPDSKKPKLTAYFEQESYRPGDEAHLVVTDTASQVSVQILRAGGESERDRAERRHARHAGHEDRLGRSRAGAAHVSISIADWPQRRLLRAADRTRLARRLRPLRPGSAPPRRASDRRRHADRRPGRRTTSATTTATASPTRGTPAGRSCRPA